MPAASHIGRVPAYPTQGHQAFMASFTKEDEDPVSPTDQWRRLGDEVKRRTRNARAARHEQTSQLRAAFRESMARAGVDPTFWTHFGAASPA